MTSIAIHNRREALDAACSTLRALVALLDDKSDALDVHVQTTTDARLLASFAVVEADEAACEIDHALGKRGIASPGYADAMTCIARATIRAVRTHADAVDRAADALDRAIRATTDDASAAEDGASLAGCRVSRRLTKVDSLRIAAKIVSAAAAGCDEAVLCDSYGEPDPWCVVNSILDVLEGEGLLGGNLDLDDAAKVLRRIAAGAA